MESVWRCPSLFIFGGCTTILNVCLYYCLRHLAGYSLNASNIAAWVGAVLFAYVTNRKWVFESKAKGALPVAKEIGRFLPAGLPQELWMWELCILR